MNPVLERWNTLELNAAAQEILPCCGSQAWAMKLAERRPIASQELLSVASDSIWRSLSEIDWMEAFDSHPRIGEQEAKAAAAASITWSASEQSKAMTLDERAKLALAKGNQKYEAKFGRIFIVCASGRSAEQILAILEKRMNNDAASELHEAAEQQRQITQLRIERWLGGR